MPIGAFTAARHMSFDDSWLAAGSGALTYRDIEAGQDFMPQAVHCDSSSDGTENTNGIAKIDCILSGENDEHRKVYTIHLHTPVGLAVRKVWAGAGTTARGISLLSEI